MASVALLLFVLGCVFGSFVTVLAYRVPRGEPWVGGRSRCPSCGAEIGARDNVPVLSWLLLRGRCRSCGEPISIRYPLVELGLGALWAITYLTLSDDAAQLALGLVLCAVLVAITLTDLDLRLIPNRLLLPAAIIAVVVVAATDPEDLVERGIAAAAAGGFLLLAALAYSGGMGMGDVKLGAVMGLYLGRAVAPALLVGFAVGALIGIGLIIRYGAGARKRAVPFGPFLAVGGVVGLWAGDELVDWYLDTFFRD
jgi:leader peptidase (prepilin peptidase)/N-methyltransferase